MSNELPVLDQSELDWHKKIVQDMKEASSGLDKAKIGVYEAQKNLEAANKAMDSWCQHLTVKYQLQPNDLLDHDGNIIYGPRAPRAVPAAPTEE